MRGSTSGCPSGLTSVAPFRGNVDGTTDLCLMFSRDKNGNNGWLRPGDPEGRLVYTGKLEQDRWNRCSRRSTGCWTWADGESGTPQVSTGPASCWWWMIQIVLYYTGLAFGHEPEGSRSDGAGKNVYRVGIGRATLRLDGFVSLRAGEEESVVTTKPLAFQGKELVVNASCPKGSLAVEILDAEGKPIAGFEGKNADPFSGDSIRHTVTWKKNSDVSSLAGKTVKLRFRLTNGDLYSFVMR